MSVYEFSLRQEVLLEIGASILGDLSRYTQRNHITSDAAPEAILSSLVWNAKQDIILAKTEAQLEQIEGQFQMARNFLAGLEAVQGIA